MSEGSPAVGGAPPRGGGAPRRAAGRDPRPRGALALTDPEVAALYLLHGSRKRAAEAAGLSEWQVRQAVERAGADTFPAGPPGRRALDSLDWPSLYREHGSCRKVAAAVGCCATTAKDRLIAAGVRMTLPRRQWSFGEAVRVATMVAEIGGAPTARAIGISRAMVWALVRRVRKGPGGEQSRRKARLPGCISRRAARRAELRGAHGGRGGKIPQRGKIAPPPPGRRDGAPASIRPAEVLEVHAFRRRVERERRVEERLTWGGCL